MTVAVAGIVAEFREHWPILLTIPVTAAIIGWVTKLLAIKMLFEPQEFRGVGPIGWQGMVPRRTAKMMTIASEAIIGPLVDPREMLDRIEPRELVARLEQPLTAATEDIGREFLSRYHPALWAALPQAARAHVLARVRARAPEAVAGVVAEVRANLDGPFDLRYAMVANAVRNRAVMTRLVRAVASPELRFMITTGVVFGTAIGTIQMLAWAATHNHMIMPLFGGFVGLFTDYVALQMVFVPQVPRRYLGLFRWHGKFFERRVSLSQSFAKVAAQDLLSPGVLVDAMLDGPMSDRVFAIVAREAQRALDEEVGSARPLVELAVGSERYRSLKRAVMQQARERAPQFTGEIEAFAGETFDIERTIAEKMIAMDADDYEAILRPMIKDDEWVIVALGAVLGFLVGELQVLIITSLGG